MKPIARELPGVLKALREVELKLNITAESRIDLNALIKYFPSFKTLIMLATWFKILQTIDYRSKVLQSPDSTIDVQVLLQHLRSNWDGIYSEACLVAGEINITPLLKESRNTARKLNASTDTERQSAAVFQFKLNVFLCNIDNLIAETTRRFQRIRDMNNKFCFLWQYPNLSESQLSTQAAVFAQIYK